jgi:UDP-glucose 4-epimerase
MKILVTGGTGSFGKAFVKRYHKKHDITVFSRDENKQFEMRAEFPNVKYEIGDVRDSQRVAQIAKGYDYVFHAAALKQVPSCEFFPLEAVKTNILGASNILEYADGKVVCLSTDKAVYPINAMGMSKALMEKVAITKGGVITRYGNVMKSRGSIIPIWQECAKKGKPLKITNPDMTRFLLSLDDSIDLVMYAMEHGNPGDTFVKKVPACTMDTLAKAVGELSGKDYKIEVIGIRHGEKMHEALISQEEMYRTEDCGEYYRIKPDSRDMNYDKFFTDGQSSQKVQSYTSSNTNQLYVEEVKELLSGLK